MPVQTLLAFTEVEVERVKTLLALKVSHMMGRKLEEGDWTEVYCAAKRIPLQGWSNLNIDVTHDNLGVEQKALGWGRVDGVIGACGKTLMHPSMTRSIRIESVEGQADDVMRDVFRQYAALVAERTAKVREQSGQEPDMRTGWLLWSRSLTDFLYWEERMSVPEPDRYFARWEDRPARGSRKASRSLWIFDTESQEKRFSVTTSAGIKIQPYFDVPLENDPNVYRWQLQGELRNDGYVRVWCTPRTAASLRRLVAADDPDALSDLILSMEAGIDTIPEDEVDAGGAVELGVSEAAYEHLVTAIGGLNDEHALQLLVDRLEGAG